MTPRFRKGLFHLLRIALCAVAMWIVIQGVTLNDHIRLQDGQGEVIGLVVQDGDHVEVQQPDGTTRTIPLDAIARDVDGEPKISYGLRTAWNHSAKGLLLLAMAIYFPIVFFQAIRIQWLLRAQEIQLGYWEAVKLSIAGNFLNFATPLGSNAGDVFKAYFLSLHTDRKTEAVTTVFLDRVVGVSTLLCVVVLITVFSPSDGRLASFRPYMLGMLGVSVAGGLAYFAPPLRRRLIPRRWLSKLPIFEQLQRIDKTAHALARHPSIVIRAVLVTAVLQAISIIAYFTVAVALAMEANRSNILEYYTYFSTGVVVQTLPGPPQGLGTVELTYKYFLAPFGSPSQIVCMAFALRVMVLLCSLPGLFVTLTGAYKPRQATRGTKDVHSETDPSEVKSIEPTEQDHDLATTFRAT